MEEGEEEEEEEDVLLARMFCNVSKKNNLNVESIVHYTESKLS